MCTDIRIIAADGTPLTVRTMEFGIDLNSQLVITPRGFTVTSPAPHGGRGLSWVTKHGYIYLNAANQELATDGLNEAGLSVGALYLPRETAYQTVAPGEEKQALSNLYVASWLLGSFATAGEVRAALGNVIVWGQPVAQLGGFAPIHYVVHDAAGDSLVIEYVGGMTAIYDHQIGVLTNSPVYDWHLQNLRNYVNLKPIDVQPVKLGNATYAATGQGSGLHGLPGDPTPPSRFVMSVAGLYLANKPKDANEALILADHLINRVDIPKGLVRDYASGGTPEADYTQWTTFRDHRNRIYYWRTYEDPALRAFDVKTADFSPGQPQRGMPIAGTTPTAIAMSTADMPALTA